MRLTRGIKLCEERLATKNSALGTWAISWQRVDYDEYYNYNEKTHRVG
jgi:hypothetical protein